MTYPPAQIERVFIRAARGRVSSVREISEGRRVKQPALCEIFSLILQRSHQMGVEVGCAKLSPGAQLCPGRISISDNGLYSRRG